ncbi:retrovirus-related pol polyprotein from transposon TNT 1-94 [Tanacetum coccineum]
MAQQQHAADVHPDELCPPNKRYDLMDANKKVDLEHVQCPSESKILMNIIKNHPLRFSIAASASVPWIYMPWQTLCKIFYKCLTTRVTGWDQPPLQIMQIRAQDAYHNLQNDDIMKNIFNSGRNKNKSQLTESTQGTYRTPRAPRSPNLATETAESMPTVEKADEVILQDMLQVSLGEHKSREEQEARENVALVYENLIAEEIQKLVKDTENVDDSSPPMHDDTYIPGTKLEPKSDKESSEVEIVQEKEEETTKDTEVEPDKDTPMVDVTNIVIPVNVNDEEDEITDEVFELKRRAKGKNVEETWISPIPSPTRSPRNLSTLVSSDTKKVQELTVTHPTPSSGSSAPKSYLSGHILHVHPAQPQTTSVPEQQYQLYLSMKVDPQLQQQDIAIWLALQMKFKILQVPQTTCITPVVRPRDQDDPQDDAHPKGENSAKQQKTSEYKAHVIGESSGQVNEKEQGQSSSRNQEQTDDYDFWTKSYASDDDEVPTKQVSQDIMEEVSLTINEAKRKKIADEMLRQRCTSGDKHQYHINQMKNFLKSDIVWESRKEILTSPHP